MKKILRNAFVGVAAAMALASTQANAVTITIGYGDDGSITNVNSCIDAQCGYIGAMGGTFTSNGIIASGSPPNVAGDLLSTTSSNISTIGAGTLTLWISASGNSEPIGDTFLRSAFTSNVLPAGWTIQMTSFLCSTDTVHCTPLNGALQLASNTFASIGIFTQVDPVTLAATYSVSHRYIITATDKNTVLSTMDLVTVPEPGSLALFGASLALLGLFGVGRRRS